MAGRIGQGSSRGSARRRAWRHRRGDGVLRMILCGRKLPLLSVDRSTGGGEDHFAHPILNAVFEEADRAQYVHFRIEVRLAHGTPYVHLGCLVAECLWLEALEDLLAPGADVCLVEMCPLGYVFALAAGEVIDYG